MERKLASIQRIKELSPIEGADRIEVARVLGWHVVVQKGLYQVGELVVYCEVDSVMPDRPEFEFLGEKRRVRTIRLRGQVSQGICFPIEDVIDVSDLDLSSTYLEGYDVTELLGVTKYEPPIPACLAGEMYGAFPGFIPKTDETRVQTLEEMLEEFKGHEFTVTEKLDGSSMTAYYYDGHFGVCSRNIELVENEGNTLWSVARANDLEQILSREQSHLAIQGEVIGDGIQGNKYNLPKNVRRLYVYNVYDINEARYYSNLEVAEFCARYGLDMVPQLPVVKVGTVDELVAVSEGVSVLNENVQREGIVLRPSVEARFNGERVSMKVINPKFLLKFEE